MNSYRRDRGFQLELEPPTYSIINGHQTIYQIHVIELDMPDENRLLYAKGAVAGWICEETGVSYASYLLFWNWGSPPKLSKSTAIDDLNNYLDTLECH